MRNRQTGRGRPEQRKTECNGTFTNKDGLYMTSCINSRKEPTLSQIGDEAQLDIRALKAHS